MQDSLNKSFFDISLIEVHAIFPNYFATFHVHERCDSAGAKKGAVMYVKMLRGVLHGRAVCRAASIVIAPLLPPLRSLLLSVLLISQQQALFLQMAPQSAVYLAWPNLWVYMLMALGTRLGSLRAATVHAHFNDNVLFWWWFQQRSWFGGVSGG